MKIRGLYDNNLYPARFGGSERIYRLYRHLAGHAEVTVLSLLLSREHARRSEVVEGIHIERRKPFYPTLAHYAERLRLLPMHSVFRLHQALGGRFAWHFREERAVYQFDSFLLTAWYDRVPAGALKVYQAVNVETDWHRGALGRLFDPVGAERSLREIERHAVGGADLVLYVSEQDKARLVSDFGARPERMMHVPNGFEPGKFQGSNTAERLEWRARLGYSSSDRVAVFTGSRMAHNLEAARFIARDLAPEASRLLPDVKFLMVGDLAEGALPPNVRCTGTVEEVPPYLSAADLALNPVTSGSGTSLKVPEFLAAGLPVVTTAFGMRGFDDLLPCVTVAALPEMLAGLRRVAAQPADTRVRLARYEWSRQAGRMLRAYEAWFENPGEAPRTWASIA